VGGASSKRIRIASCVDLLFTASGLSRDGSRWIAKRPDFFLPVRVLSKLFRRLIYGPNTSERYRETAGYVDRILKVKSRATFLYKRQPNSFYCSIKRALGHHDGSSEISRLFSCKMF
jgi:hypothetical protein